jgi:uncharacterized integral membrane protein
MNPADTFAPIALHVILALIAGALIGSVWDAWRERRHRRREAERIALDTLRWLHARRTL